MEMLDDTYMFIIMQRLKSDQERFWSLALNMASTKFRSISLFLLVYFSITSTTASECLSTGDCTTRASDDLWRGRGFLNSKALSLRGFLGFRV